MTTLDNKLKVLTWLKARGLGLDEIKFLVSPESASLASLEIQESTESLQHPDEQVCPKPAQNSQDTN